MAQPAKMPSRPPQEQLGNAHRCRDRAEYLAGSVTCSKIEGRTFPSSHIENPSGGSILSRRRQVVVAAQNTRAPVLQAVRAGQRLHTIWFSTACEAVYYNSRVSGDRSLFENIYVPRKTPSHTRMRANANCDKFMCTRAQMKRLARMSVHSVQIPIQNT